MSLQLKTPPDIPIISKTQLFSLHDIAVHVEGVTKLPKTFSPHKAPGPDHIHPRFLKEVAEEIAPALALIFQALINQGKLPKEWKTATVCPVLKKGDRATPANYRPISLTCIKCKCLVYIIHSSIMNHLHAHNMLDSAL